MSYKFTDTQFAAIKASVAVAAVTPTITFLKEGIVFITTR